MPKQERSKLLSKPLEALPECRGTQTTENKGRKNLGWRADLSRETVVSYQIQPSRGFRLQKVADPGWLPWSGTRRRRAAIASLRRPLAEVDAHGGEAFFHVCAAIADAEAVGWSGTQIGLIDTCGEEQHAGLLDEVLGEDFNPFGAQIPGISDAAAIGQIPLEEVSMFVEESLEEGQVLGN